MPAKRQLTTRAQATWLPAINDTPAKLAVAPSARATASRRAASCCCSSTGENVPISGAGHVMAIRGTRGTASQHHERGSARRTRGDSISKHHHRTAPVLNCGRSRQGCPAFCPRAFVAVTAELVRNRFLAGHPTMRSDWQNAKGAPFDRTREQPWQSQRHHISVAEIAKRLVHSSACVIAGESFT